MDEPGRFRDYMVVAGWAICQIALIVLIFALAGCGTIYHTYKDGLLR